jgi:hypothetical protein
MLPESSVLEASTRHYGRQEPIVAGSAPLPPSIGDAVAGDTARYQQPSPAPMPSYMPPARVLPVARTSSLKSKRRYLKWGGFVLALFISGGIGAAINEESNSDRFYLSREDRVRLERLQTEDRINGALTGSVVERQERLREELGQRLEAIERAREEAERAAERGDLASPGEKPLDLTAYEYPGASGGQYSRIPGREMLTGRTPDNFETVIRHYQEKLGKPFVQVGERNQKQALFQSTGTPSVTVLVREIRDRSRQPEIIILRSPFRFTAAQPEAEKPATEANPKEPAESKP